MSTDRAGPLGDLQAPFVRPSGATEILLVRHGSATEGQSASPVSPHRSDGHADPCLSAAGTAQARAIARRVARLPVDRLFVTTLRRTQQTAEPISDALRLAPEVVHDLREVGLGDLEGDEFEKRRLAGDPVLTQAYATQRWDVIPGAEPMAVFAERVRRGLEHLARATGPDATAVAVVHGGVIAELCHQVTGSDRFAFINVENASITMLLRTAAGRWRLRSFNDTAHLPPAALRR